MNIYILRGIPGSGKSTWAKFLRIQNLPGFTPIASADHYFLNVNGEYIYKPEEKGAAHQACYAYFCECIEGAFTTIVVDNTNTTLNEVDRYLQTGINNGYKVTVLNFEISPELSFQRNTHNVPKDVIAKMHQRFVSNHNKIEKACQTNGASFKYVKVLESIPETSKLKEKI